MPRGLKPMGVRDVTASLLPNEDSLCDAVACTGAKHSDTSCSLGVVVRDFDLEASGHHFPEQVFDLFDSGDDVVAGEQGNQSLSPNTLPQLVPPFSFDDAAARTGRPGTRLPPESRLDGIAAVSPSRWAVDMGLYHTTSSIQALWSSQKRSPEQAVPKLTKERVQKIPTTEEAKELFQKLASAEMSKLTGGRIDTIPTSKEAAADLALKIGGLNLESSQKGSPNQASNSEPLPNEAKRRRITDDGRSAEGVNVQILPSVFNCTHDAFAVFSASTGVFLAFNIRFCELACLLGTELTAGLALLRVHMVQEIHKMPSPNDDRKVHVYSAQLPTANGLYLIKVSGRVIHSGLRDNQVVWALQQQAHHVGSPVANSP